jgi:hypothetical protein
MPAAAREALPPKRIAVNGRPIRLRWLQQIIWSFLAANAGALIMVALYYLFVQLRWHVGGHTLLNLKPDWDNLFSFRGWAADRHDFRNVYEAILATLFVKSLLANWRKHDRRAPARRRPRGPRAVRGRAGQRRRNSAVTFQPCHLYH